MEDEHQSTLKKKIQILFQLGKWPDVVKLSDSYMEKYGKDMEIDMIRFKSERHMGIPASPTSPKADATPAAPAVEEPPLVLSRAEEAAEIAVPQENVPLSMDTGYPETRESAESGPRKDNGNDMFGGEVFAEDELVITDPFELDEPGMSMAPEQPPVDLNESGVAPEAAVSHMASLEMESPADVPPSPPGEEEEVDFRNVGAMTLDAEPELTAAPVTEGGMSAPGARTSRAGEEAGLEDDFRSGANGVDVVEEPEPERPVVFAKPGTDEMPSRPGSPLLGEVDGKAAQRRKFFTPKLALLIILPIIAAVSLWLALTGKLNFSGTEEPAASSEPVGEAPVVRRPRPKIKVPPAAVALQADAQEKAFNEKFQQAEELYKKGELLKAWAVLLEAKKIKTTEPLLLLEGSLATRIRAAEEKAKQQTQVVQSQWELENQAFERAKTENTLAAWQDFLKAYPQGEFSSQAGKKIALFAKQAQDLADQQLLQKIQQAQKIRPRSSYLSVSQADISALIVQGGKPPTQFEAYERGGVRMLLDYASGSMWTLWNKPMVYEKAKWWANRVTAGFGGWRLPTAEEALALLQADRGQYSGLADFSVWTGDTVSDLPRTAWVLKIPEGRFAPAGYMQAYYVWAVRKAGK